LPLKYISQDVDILIGQDHAEALVPLDVRKGNAGEPFAVKSILGWTLNGSDRPKNSRHQSRQAFNYLIKTDMF
jgi:hypothetical protein